MQNQPKIALVHDYLNQWGGAERVLWHLHQLYPHAPIYTMFWDSGQFQSADSELNRFTDSDVRASWLQKLPRWLRNSRMLLPFYPTAVEHLDLSEFDIVISDSSAWSKGVITRPGTAHICYCHSPTRYLWDWHERYLQEQRIGKFKKIFVVPLLSYLRLWDRFAADRVDHFIANSSEVKRRIKKYYNRDATVIYPPVPVKDRIESLPADVKRDQKIHFDGTEQDENYYLIVSRLSGYKAIDLAIDACNRLQVKLKIIGTGRDMEKLQQQAWSNVEFLGHVSDQQLQESYMNSKALLMPGVEDFGLVMVEAMTYGKPVVAFQAAGALEIVQEGVNGRFFDRPDAYSLMDTLRRFEQEWQEGYYQPADVARTVLRFDEEVFVQKIKQLINEI